MVAKTLDEEKSLNGAWQEPHIGLKDWIESCPTIKALDVELGGQLIQVAERLRRRRRRSLLQALLVVLPVVALAVAGGEFLALRGSTLSIVGGVTLALLAYVFEFVMLRLLNRRTAVSSIPLTLLELIGNLERLPGHWAGDLSDRRWLARQFEPLARHYQSLGGQLRTGDGWTDAEMSRWTRGIAARVRSYKLWVLRPGDLTYTDLVGDLGEDLRLVLGRRWQYLRSVEQSRLTAGVPRRTRVAWAAVGVVLAGAAVAAFVYSKQLGDQGPAIVTAILTVALLALNRAGFSIQKFSDASEAAKGLGGGGKKDEDAATATA